MTLDQFMQRFEKRTKTAKGFMVRCPGHEDKEASLSVAQGDKGVVLHCFAGCDNSAICAAMGLTIKDLFAEPLAKPASLGYANEKREIVKTYSYTDALGRELFQVVRMIPKTFRQRHSDGKGGWIWSMENVERVLYRLPAVLAAKETWICEGEKDVESLVALGFCATCNVSGAGKWLDGYTESLAGKDVILCGDNDEPGRKHMETVFDSLAPRAKTVRIIKLPSSFKDVTDFIDNFKNPEVATKELSALAAVAIPHMGGIKMPVYSMAEIEPRYREQVLNSDAVKLDLSKWLPSLRRVRPLVAGELALFIGNTGAGKTALLQNIAVNAKHLRTVMFEMELPEELLFERFVALKKRITCREVEDSYRVSEEGADAMNIQFPNLCICTEPKQTLESLEAIINRAELKMGGKPSLVLIDYVQLMQAKGSRYEKTSDVAEGLKIIAKSTKTIIVVASQVARPSIDTPKIGLHSGKDSGSLENSAGLVIGAWRDSTDESAMHVKVLKATKGGAGTELVCNFDGARMTITERINDPTDMFTKRP